jgi:hypothetical protein
MPRRWLSLWNRKVRQGRNSTTLPHPTDADIWIPYGAGRIAVNDVVYCVAVDNGEVLFFGRLTVGRIAIDDTHKESIDVWQKRRTGTWFDPARVLDEATVEGLMYVKADGTQQRFVRDAGRVTGYAFQGRASLRELVAGHEALEAIR